MEPLFKQLEELTHNLMNDLSSIDADGLERFVEQREAMIGQLLTVSAQGIRPEYRERVKRLVSCDQAIIARMNALRLEAAEGMRKIELGRQQRNMYETSYIQDSVFFDKKK